MKPVQIQDAWNGPERCRSCGIRHLVLFADLQHVDFAMIHEPIDDLEFAEGETLYQTGGAPGFVFTVREGLVKLVHYLPDGNHRIVRLLKQGDVAGLEALTGQPYHHDAIPLTPLAVCRIPVTVVDRLSRDTPRLHAQLMERWQRVVSDAEAWVCEMSTGHARARVARLLLKLARYTDPDNAYYPTREDMGAMLGITTETASRITAEFKRKGLLERVSPGRVRVNAQGLEAIARQG